MFVAGTVFSATGCASTPTPAYRLGPRGDRAAGGCPRGGADLGVGADRHAVGGLPG